MRHGGHAVENIRQALKQVKIVLNQNKQVLANSLGRVGSVFLTNTTLWVKVRPYLFACW
jgi:hypothetical protein